MLLFASVHCGMLTYIVVVDEVEEISMLQPSQRKSRCLLFHHLDGVHLLAHRGISPCSSPQRSGTAKCFFVNHQEPYSGTTGFGGLPMAIYICLTTFLLARFVRCVEII